MPAIDRFLSWIPWEDKNRIEPQYENLEEWKRHYPSQQAVILESYSRLTVDNFYVNLQKAYYTEVNAKSYSTHLTQQPDVDRQTPGAKEQPVCTPHSESAAYNREIYSFWLLCAENCPAHFLTQLVEMAVRNRFSLKPLLTNLSLEDWDICAAEMARHIELPDMDAFCEKLLPGLSKSGYPLFAERLVQHFRERQLTQGLLEPTHLMTLLNEYCKSVICDAKAIYRDEVLNDPDSHVLPAKYKFAVRIRDILQLMETKDYAGCVSILSEALHLYPQLSIAVSGLTKYLNEQLKKPPKPVSPEFEVLDIQVKQVLRGLMANKQWNEAYGVNAQLVALLPDDLEILRLKQEILTSLSTSPVK